MKKIGIVADDLTGGTTVGVLLARSGVSSAVFFDIDGLETSTNHDAFIISTDSRALPESESQEKVKSAVNSLKNRGAVHFSKRIDTTLRGNIGAEVRAMLDELDSDTVAVMVPSMPQSNRIIVGGYSIIDSIPLSKTAVATDIKTPVTESHCPTLIGTQTDYQIGTISLQSVLSGKESLQKALHKERSEGARIIIVDAVTMEDIDLIAKATTELEWKMLAVDPGPFTERLAEYNGYALQKKETETTGAESENNGTVFVVAGSASPITKVQLETLMDEEDVAHIPLSAEALVDRTKTAEAEIRRGIAEATSILENAKPQVIIFETALNGKRLDLDEQERKLSLKPGEASNNINLGLGEIVRKILDKDTFNVRGLYMTGGDTMAHVLHTLDAKGIEMLDYVIPQADLGRIIGSKHDGLVVVGKGGLTGSKDTGISIVDRIFKESV